MDINRDELKFYFERGDRPTQEQFEDLIDSQVNKVDDQVFVVGSKVQNNVQIGLGLTPPNDTTDVGLVRLFVDQRLSTQKLRMRENPGAGKLLFSDASGNARWGAQTDLDEFHWKRVNKTDPNSVMYSVPAGNVGIGTSTPTAKLHVFGSTTVDGLTKTQSLRFTSPVPAGNPDGRVLMLDPQGNVTVVAVADLHTPGYDLWWKDQWNVHSKPGFGVSVDKGLYVEEKVTVKGGIIRNPMWPTTDPEPAISNDLTDLGLYSFHKWNWNRYVTNNGAHRFYLDLGKGLDPNGPSGVLEVIPSQKKNLFRPTGNGDYVRLPNDTVQVNADFFVKGWKPFLFRTYKLDPQGNVGDGGDPTFKKWTGISVEEYPGAIIGGFTNTLMTFRQTDPGDNFVRLAQDGTSMTWVVEANFANNLTNGRDENDWYVDVMFVRVELADAHWSFSKHWAHDGAHPVGTHV